MDETPRNGWTLDTLRLHLASQIEALDRRVDDRLKASERALELARDADEKRLHAALTAARDAVEKAHASQKEQAQRAETAQEARNQSQNEWRATLSDINATRMPRSEATAMFTGFDGRLILTNTRLDKIEGKSTGVAASFGIIIAVVAAAIAVGGLILNVMRPH